MLLLLWHDRGQTFIRLQRLSMSRIECFKELGLQYSISCFLHRACFKRKHFRIEDLHFSTGLLGTPGWIFSSMKHLSSSYSVLVCIIISKLAEGRICGQLLELSLLFRSLRQVSNCTDWLFWALFTEDSDSYELFVVTKVTLQSECCFVHASFLNNRFIASCFTRSTELQLETSVNYSSFLVSWCKKTL